METSWLGLKSINTLEQLLKATYIGIAIEAASLGMLKQNFSNLGEL